MPRFISAGVRLLSAASLLLCAITLCTAQSITVSTNKVVIPKFMGLGVQWDPFEYQPTPAEWTTITKRMAFCKPGYLRVMWTASSYCLGLRSDGSPEYVWQHGYSSKRGELNKLCSILQFAQHHNVRVLLGEWSPPIGLIGTETNPVWARITVDLLHYLRDERGFACIRYYNAINEPNGNWSGNKDYPTWVTVIKNLYEAFAKAGISKQVLIIGPDTTGNSSWMEPFNWLDRSVQDLNKQIGAWDLHWYALDPEVYNDVMERILTKKTRMLQQAGPVAANKQRFMGESGMLTGRVNGDQQPRVKTFSYGVIMSDYCAQVARAGWMGASAWDLDDAMHTVKSYKNPPDALTLKVWGFWNSEGAAMGDPADFNIRPWFYTWSLMSRLFPRGSQIVYSTAAPLPQFRNLAGIVKRNGRKLVTIMLVNDSNVSHTVTVKVPSAAKNVTLTVYHYFKTDRPTNRSGFAIPSSIMRHVNLHKGVRFTLPSQGVIFLTQQGS